MSGAGLAECRRRYAATLVAALPRPDPRIEAAFATVRREDFLGPPPWTLLGFPHSWRSDDAAELYQDVLVALDAQRSLNNGSPALHALMLQHLDAAPGDSVLHVGAGTGYYTAVLAELAGPRGHVTAVEFDRHLAAQARQNLAGWPNVSVVQGDGADFPHAPTQRIYVNFGVAGPAPAWLDQLTPGGTLLFPLCVPSPRARGEDRHHSAHGAALCLTRTGAGYAARHVAPVAFVCAEGPLAGEADTQKALYSAFNRGGVEFVGSFRRGASAPARCWFWSPAWSLSYQPP
jgi:protein-L-isoaspartate(D-aspartate) O-methyltransferase